MLDSNQEATKKGALLLAAKKAGGQSKLARKIGVSLARFNNWLNRPDKIKPKYALAIVRFCEGAVTFPALCPEEYFLNQFINTPQTQSVHQLPLTLIQHLPESLIKHYQRLKRPLPSPIDSNTPIIIDEYYQPLAFFDRLQAHQHASRTTIPAIIVNVAQHWHNKSPIIAITTTCTISERVIISNIMRQREKQYRGSTPNNHKVCPKSDTILRLDTRIATLLALGSKSTYHLAHAVVTHANPDLIQAMDTKRITISLAARIAKYPPALQRDLLKLDQKTRRKQLAILATQDTKQAISARKVTQDKKRIILSITEEHSTKICDMLLQYGYFQARPKNLSSYMLALH